REYAEVAGAQLSFEFGARIDRNHNRHTSPESRRSLRQRGYGNIVDDASPAAWIVVDEAQRLNPGSSKALSNGATQCTSSEQRWTPSIPNFQRRSSPGY